VLREILTVWASVWVNSQGQACIGEWRNPDTKTQRKSCLIPVLDLLFEFRIGFTPEERQVLGHLHRPVARREHVNANVVDASPGSDLRVSVRPVDNSRFFEPQ
jgi:hypothetical protein